MSGPVTQTRSGAVSAAVEQARALYAARRPRTVALHERAQAFLPGGNTRSVLYHPPFPLRIARAWEAILEDVDGHEYVHLLGEYSAGLYGHSHPVVIKAMADALQEGISRGAHTRYEVDLAEVICARFPSIERVRFTNSGTEANLMALSAGRAFTGRDRVLVFRGGYHGGLLTFKDGPSPVNAPYDVLLAGYNDTAGAQALLREHAGEVACVLVEPMLGSGGCIPGDPAFLSALREATRQAGALLIFDEVMTSRTGSGGLQARLGIRPDLTTLESTSAAVPRSAPSVGAPTSWSCSTQPGRVRFLMPAPSTTTWCRWPPATLASPRSTRPRLPTGIPPGATACAGNWRRRSGQRAPRSRSPAWAACSPSTRRRRR